MKQHSKVIREQDEMVCHDCGKRWDVGDTEPSCAPSWQVRGYDGTKLTLQCNSAGEAEDRARKRGVNVAMVVPV